MLFAVTLFVSASLLFMVQPMVGKLVLPLLGGSPAVWNACMVFFQALLLLGYLYADRLTRHASPKQQWIIHLGVLALPILMFALAITVGTRHTPIAIVESLAPTDESSPILSVLTILTIAIGVPFFVISTTATLLQKWFTYTGHPSARDPYFLYAASNLGSLISLLGYPLFIEPNLSQGGQTWLFATGFAALIGLIAFCGKAAVNPLGVPPTPTTSKVQTGQNPQGTPVVAPSAGSEPPPSWARMAKWTALAFVPSSLMLGVTFHMTTDIASIPLLWVGPLALYLITFIIAFGRVPPWFRVLIGNLAPVMILLLVFVMISKPPIGVGLELLLHLLTFFAAALMCHYELARDRPSPQHLTTYFLIMSLGGVLGGIFNSLVAPLVFPHAYEYPLALIVACLMVPRLLGEKSSDSTELNGKAVPPAGASTSKIYDWVEFACVLTLSITLLIGLVVIYQLGAEDSGLRKWLFIILLSGVGVGVVGVCAVEGYAQNRQLPFGLSQRLWHKTPEWLRAVLLFTLSVLVLPWAIVGTLWSKQRMRLFLDLIIPVLVGIAFWQLRELQLTEWFAGENGLVAKLKHTFSLKDGDPVRMIFIYAIPVMICFFFVDRPLRFALCVAAILGQHKYNEEGRDILYSERSFFGILKVEESGNWQRPIITTEDGKRKPGGEIEYVRLVHGTTLHGTQVKKLDKNVLDMFQALTAAHPLENITIAGAVHVFDMRQEPLTYYHRSGPVGAMFAELTRKGRDREHVAMVGLGTGSVSCYAQKGQKLTYYEIDPAVRRIVETPWKVMNPEEVKQGKEPIMGPFTYVDDARKRGAEIDFRMGDARLKLKEDTDRKYALLLVDAFSSDSIPVHLLTIEAVQLYLERITEDGILALHISNKFVSLEPVVAKIAQDLRQEYPDFTALVWNDNVEERAPGKTASSWVVLAKKRETLGKLYSPIADLIDEFGGDEQIRRVVESRYPDIKQAIEKAPTKQQDAMIEWLKARTDDKQAQFFARLMDDYGAFKTLMPILLMESGHGFRPVRGAKNMSTWTDDYADVMRVMMIPQLQKIRSFFGLPGLRDE
ncbi:MAG: fused MFS/spermidine synthase [Planctomycetia bacterium]|nr:fused MFS/spermidine synthase [Planctomycetia bacterium]